MHRLALAVVGLVASSFLVAISPTAAHADFGCPGTRDVWRPYKNSAGVVAAELQGYETATGYCYSLVSRNQYFGRSKYMRIRVCNLQREQCVTDEGQYEQYAGPIYRDFPAASLHCASVRSTMKDGHGNTIMDHWVDMGSCN